MQQVLLQNRPRQDRALKEFMTAPLSWKLLAQARLQQAADGPGQEGGLRRDGGRPGLKALGPLCRLGLCFASLKAWWEEPPRSPMHPPLTLAGPGLTNASLPPDGHGPLLRCMLGGPACMGSHTRFQSILGPCRQKEETVTSWSKSGGLSSGTAYLLPGDRRGVPWESRHSHISKKSPANLWEAYMEGLQMWHLCGGPMRPVWKGQVIFLGEGRLFSLLRPRTTRPAAPSRAHGDGPEGANEATVASLMCVHFSPSLSSY